MNGDHPSVAALGDTFFLVAADDSPTYWKTRFVFLRRVDGATGAPLGPPTSLQGAWPWGTAVGTIGARWLVWRSRDGANWELVTAAAAWPSRPGHQAVVLANDIYLFGGFGLSTDPADPFKPANPMDLWVSRDGAHWRLISNSPWNATTPEEIKYDFKALAVTGGRGGLLPSIFTFGGDRETFNFANPENYLRVDNDVWRFSPRLGPWR